MRSPETLSPDTNSERQTYLDDSVLLLHIIRTIEFAKSGVVRGLSVDIVPVATMNKCAADSNPAYHR